MPALFTQTSRRPKYSTAALTSDCRSATPADVGIHAHRAVTQGSDLLLELVGRLGVGHVVDHDVRAAPGKRQHDGLADAAVAAGDHGDRPPSGAPWSAGRAPSAPRPSSLATASSDMSLLLDVPPPRVGHGRPGCVGPAPFARSQASRPDGTPPTTARAGRMVPPSRPGGADDRRRPGRDRCAAARRADRDRRRHRRIGIKAAPVDLQRATSPMSVTVPTPHPATPDAVAATVAELVDGFGCAGPVGVTCRPCALRDHPHGGEHRPGWIGTDAAALHAGAIGREVTVLNDADAAGLAEVRHGAGRDSGVVCAHPRHRDRQRRVHRGTLVPNTELGHLPLHGDDAEHYAASSVRTPRTSPGRLRATTRALRPPLERVFSPELFIIGGGVSKRADKFLPRISSTTPLVPAELHNDAGIVGAAMAARR